MLTRAHVLAREQRGVTLIELIVTLTVLGLLVLSVAPSIIDWLADTRVRNAATGLQNGLQRARVEAIRRNTPVRFSLVNTASPLVLDNTCALAANGVSWTVSRADPSAKCATDISEVVDPFFIETKAAGSGRFTVSAVDAANVAANTVIFNSFGRVANANAIAQVNITGNAGVGRPLRLTIGGAGTMRLCDPNISNVTDPRRC